jgi:hypothetical protein
MTPTGVVNAAPVSVALTMPDARIGLVHARISVSSPEATAGLLWRYEDAGNHWGLSLTPAEAFLFVVIGGERHILASARTGISSGAGDPVEISDDGHRIAVRIDGSPIFGDIEDGRLAAAKGVGIQASGPGGVTMREFEAHPRTVQIPSVLRLGAPWEAQGGRTLVIDGFEGPARDFAGTTTSVGGKVWHRILGEGSLELTGERSIRVLADVSRPNPGRTAYAVDWDNPDFADVDVEIVPPGTGPGQNERCRGGLIYWQDEDNYLAISDYLDDWHVGKSVSSFFRLGGHEDLYQAVWSCVGSRLHWGVPHRFRCVFDGEHYSMFLDGELVLHRSLTDVDKNAKRLKIRKIGLLVNWEFGDDTGTRFRDFRASG